MGRNLLRSAKHDGPSVIEEEQSTAAKCFTAAGEFFHKRRRRHRAITRTTKQAVVPEYAKTEEEIEREEHAHLEDWHQMVHTVATLLREQDQFENVVKQAEVEQLVAEARSLINQLNHAYGWESGEPMVADRMFGVDVEKVLGQALSASKIDFGTKKMVDTMRSISRGAQHGKSRIAMVAAVRNLVGGVTVNEAQLLEDQKRLEEDDFAEYVGFADKLMRAQERAISAKLGKVIAAPTSKDLNELSIADERQLRR